jgi:hypothetical protein
MNSLTISLIFIIIILVLSSFYVYKFNYLPKNQKSLNIPSDYVSKFKQLSKEKIFDDKSLIINTDENNAEKCFKYCDENPECKGVSISQKLDQDKWTCTFSNNINPFEFKDVDKFYPPNTFEKIKDESTDESKDENKDVETDILITDYPYNYLYDYNYYYPYNYPIVYHTYTPYFRKPWHRLRSKDWDRKGSGEFRGRKEPRLFSGRTRPEGGMRGSPGGGMRDSRPEGGMRGSRPEGGMRDSRPEGGMRDSRPEGGMRGSPGGGGMRDSPGGGGMRGSPGGGGMRGSPGGGGGFRIGGGGRAR